MNKLSLWLNCSTGRDRAGTGRRGAYGQALGTNARLVIFPSLPPLLFFFPHCDRCRVAKFIPNLIAVRQWTQCWIVYYRYYTNISHSLYAGGPINASSLGQNPKTLRGQFYTLSDFTAEPGALVTVFSVFHHCTKKPTKCFEGGVSLPFIGSLDV